MHRVNRRECNHCGNDCSHRRLREALRDLHRWARRAHHRGWRRRDWAALHEERERRSHQLRSEQHRWWRGRWWKLRWRRRSRFGRRILAGFATGIGRFQRTCRSKLAGIQASHRSTEVTVVTHSRLAYLPSLIVALELSLRSNTLPRHNSSGQRLHSRENRASVLAPSRSAGRNATSSPCASTTTMAGTPDRRLAPNVPISMPLHTR